MIARLDEIGKDLKEARKELKESRMLIDKLSAQNKKAEKILLEHQVMSKEYKKLEKKFNDFLDRLTFANTH